MVALFPLSLEGGLLPEGSVMAACFSPSATAGLVLSLCLSPSLWDWEEELLGRPCGRGSGVTERSRNLFRALKLCITGLFAMMRLVR